MNYRKLLQQSIGLSLILWSLSGCGKPQDTATALPTLSTATHTLMPPTATVTRVATQLDTATAIPSDTPDTRPPAHATSGDIWISPIDGMELIYIPEGEFLMGDNSAGSQSWPQHLVFLDSFWIDRTEVTNQMYLLCVLSGACTEPVPASLSGESPQLEVAPGDHPVTFVLWSQARDYCDWANRRLPTEAEWEKAARGTDGRIYPWGNTFNQQFVSARVDAVYSHPNDVSPYGAMNMAGNAWEWVFDVFDENYYAVSPYANPHGPSHSDEFYAYVIRGGDYPVIGAEDHYRVTARFASSEMSWPDVGFRCAVSEK